MQLHMSDLGIPEKSQKSEKKTMPYFFDAPSLNSVKLFTHVYRETSQSRGFFQKTNILFQS